jgi:kynurenine formamidase
MSGRFVELSHPIHDGLVTYPGLPAPVIRVHTSRADSAAALGSGESFEIAAIDMVANTGTYLDSPAHYVAGGADLSHLPLSGLVDLPGIVIRAAGHVAIEPFLVAGYSLLGKAVLFDTGWSAKFGTPAYAGADAPYLTAGTVRALLDHGAALVGIDSVNIDNRSDPARPAHAALLRAGIPIVEHLASLAALPATGFLFSAAPPMIAGMATFPVRAYAKLDRA